MAGNQAASDYPLPYARLGRVLIKLGLEQDAIDVRYGPNSGAKADIARLPSWAMRRHPSNLLMNFSGALPVASMSDENTADS